MSPQGSAPTPQGPPLTAESAANGPQQTNQAQTLVVPSVALSGPLTYERVIATHRKGRKGVEVKTIQNEISALRHLIEILDETEAGECAWMADQKKFDERLSSLTLDRSIRSAVHQIRKTVCALAEVNNPAHTLWESYLRAYYKHMNAGGKAELMSKNEFILRCFNATGIPRKRLNAAKILVRDVTFERVQVLETQLGAEGELTRWLINLSDNNMATFQTSYGKRIGKAVNFHYALKWEDWSPTMKAEWNDLYLLRTEPVKASRKWHLHLENVPKQKLFTWRIRKHDNSCRSAGKQRQEMEAFYGWCLLPTVFNPYGEKNVWRSGPEVSIFDAHITGTWQFSPGHVTNLASLVERMLNPEDTIGGFLRAECGPPIEELLSRHISPKDCAEDFVGVIVPTLNTLVKGPCLFANDAFRSVQWRPETVALSATNPTGPDVNRSNRFILEDAFPRELSRNHITKDLLSLALVTYQDLFDQYLAFRKAHTLTEEQAMAGELGRFNRSCKTFIEFTSSLLNSLTGFIYLRKDIYFRPRDKGFAAANLAPHVGTTFYREELRKEVEVSDDDDRWYCFCKGVRDYMERTSRLEFDPNYKTRDMSPIARILALDDPITAVGELLSNLEDAEPVQDHWRQFHHRKLLFLKIIAVCPLRIIQFAIMTGHHLVKIGATNSKGAFYQIHFTKEEFKNERFIPEWDYFFDLSEDYTPFIDSFLQSDWAVLNGKAFESDDRIFAARDEDKGNANPPMRREVTDKIINQLSKMCRETTARHLGAKYKTPGFYPHAFRHIGATSIIKVTGSYEEAALLLWDAVKTVRLAYSHVKRVEQLSSVGNAHYLRIRGALTLTREALASRMH
jgi:hypothetical protein